jgi:hypothetical protein
MTRQEYGELTVEEHRAYLAYMADQFQGRG